MGKVPLMGLYQGRMVLVGGGVAADCVNGLNVTGAPNSKWCLFMLQI